MTYEAFLARKREWMRNSIYIYALIDPRTEEVRYVGKSIRPLQRVKDHCNDPARTHRTNWLRELRAAGRKPWLTILEVLPKTADWQAAERRWIAICKAQGFNLTNGTSGGDGVPDLSPAARARVVAAWTGRKHRPETLLKMGAASRGRVHTAEWRASMRQKMAGRAITWTDKISKALSKLTDDQVREIRAALKARVSQYALAERYGVHQGTISNIKRGLCYRHVTESA